MRLDLLPTRADSAAGNMAADFLLLQRYPEETHARFRCYGWHRPALTFGFSQKLAWVREQLRSDEHVELCRRPTGGGLVDHRNDWTYALVIPRGHPLYDTRAIESYRAVHQALAEALQAHGCPAELKLRCEPAAGEDKVCVAPGVCFQRAELFDVVHATTQAKIAGAAQKRNKRGLLFQGSIWRPTAGTLDWESLGDAFSARLAEALAAEPNACAWPDFDEELTALTEQYASPEWLEQR
jgi:lipoyl(octanoyl) transferase